MTTVRTVLGASSAEAYPQLLYLFELAWSATLDTAPGAFGKYAVEVRGGQADEQGPENHRTQKNHRPPAFSAVELSSKTAEDASGELMFLDSQTLRLAAPFSLGETWKQQLLLALALRWQGRCASRKTSAPGLQDPPELSP
eukprot:CAMPEP_0184320536 /NCGR_PEP_ID=MMETSP1049-20130417/114342_1 /TAXON_ID=77928 /ORGANISM="Proteomonas sulcata, Strain CCMP704" /LENGTH=140 /DNA_ID=CAMNT_0026641063 /DNA_START=639 /DNA_END=1063 /DNA_ORIENTATION=-